MELTREELQKELEILRKGMVELSDKIHKLDSHPFKVGQWVKLKSREKCIICITDLQKKKGYGSDTLGDWSDLDNANWTFYENPQDWELATDKEVEDMLIKESKRRGFEKGVKFKSAWNGSEFKFLRAGRFTIDLFRTNLVNHSDGSIFYNGKWAEIIEEENFSLHGYEIEIDDTHVKFGCKHFDQDSVRSLLENMIECDIESITIDEDFEISRVEIKEIVKIIDNYKNI